jgi:hypothetical protein
LRPPLAVVYSLVSTGGFHYAPSFSRVVCSGGRGGSGGAGSTVETCARTTQP